MSTVLRSSDLAKAWDKLSDNGNECYDVWDRIKASLRRIAEDYLEEYPEDDTVDDLSVFKLDSYIDDYDDYDD